MNKAKMIVEESTIIFYSWFYLYIIKVFEQEEILYMKTTSLFESQFYRILRDIDSFGFRERNERTGVETIRIPHAIFQVDLQKEFPILRSKRVFWESALDEILWIMQRQSNNVKDLKPHIWDEWTDENGSIGKAYGYQVGRSVKTHEGYEYPSQVHYVLETLHRDPSDRRCLINLWSVGDMGEMNLNPCCFLTDWTIINGKLNCLLVQRSADFLVGVPFNTTQYSILTHLFARHLGVEVGQLTHVMCDCHVYCYESHLKGMKTMLNRMEALQVVSGGGVYQKDNEIAKEATRISGKKPTFQIYSDNTDFFKIKPEECKVENYECFAHIPLDVAV